jgi:hypothetical protein
MDGGVIYSRWWTAVPLGCYRTPLEQKEWLLDVVDLPGSKSILHTVYTTVADG